MVCTFFCITSAVQGQGNHDDHHNEIAIAIGGVPIIVEQKFALGLHAHFLRKPLVDKRWAFGFGLESILDEHRHYTASVVSQFNVYQGLNVAFAPGLLFRKEGDVFVQSYSTHFEITYEFDFDDLHLGPVAEIGIEPVGVHFMFGIHLGAGF